MATETTDKKYCENCCYTGAGWIHYPNYIVFPCECKDSPYYGFIVSRKDTCERWKKEDE